MNRTVDLLTAIKYLELGHKVRVLGGNKYLMIFNDILVCVEKNVILPRYIGGVIPVTLDFIQGKFIVEENE